jgi:hypothetical protein
MVRVLRILRCRSKRAGYIRSEGALFLVVLHPQFPLGLFEQLADHDFETGDCL